MGILIAQKVDDVSTTKKTDLGFKFVDPNSNKTYRYVRANEALVLGDIVTAMWAEIDGACDAVAAGAKTFLDAAVTFTSTMVNSFIKINANTANINQKPNRITEFVDANNLKMEDAWVVALTTSENYVLYNPWKVEKCDAAVEKIVGVAQLAVAANEYFWMQTAGYCDHVGVIVTSGIVAHRPIVSSTTAGKGKAVAAPPAGDSYATASMLTALKDLENPGILAIMPTAIAQTIPAILNLEI